VFTRKRGREREKGGRLNEQEQTVMKGKVRTQHAAGESNTKNQTRGGRATGTSFYSFLPTSSVHAHSVNPNTFLPKSTLLQNRPGG